jgi:hypothetical protein
VTRSLARGLRQLGIGFTLNPLRAPDAASVWVVLGSVEALRQAMDLKQRRGMELLLAGPNLMVRSDEYGGILASMEVDACIVPSDWVGTAYIEDAPGLKGRIRTWYAGVDEEYWRAPPMAKRRNALVYWKNADPKLCMHIEKELEKAGWTVLRMRYGHYSRAAYRRALAKSRFAVFLSRSESQGIALAEAWAMDVPTLAWEPDRLVIGGRAYSEFSASPYMNRHVGLRWKSQADFSELLTQLPQRLPHFSPRAWVEQNMTDKQAALKLVNIVDELLSRKGRNTQPSAVDQNAT